MGFINQFSRKINARTTTVISKDASSGDIASSSLQTMGGAFVLLDAKVSTNPPVRLRLYTDSSSMVIDANRAAGNFNLSQSVGLIADINLTTTEKLVFAPPVIGHTNEAGLVWYNLSGSGLQNVTLTTYALNDIGDSYENKQAVNISGSQIPVTGGSIYGVSGSITAPKSFLILSGSATSESRLRLYSSPYTAVPLSEMTRSFDTASQSGSLLIADLIFDSGSFQYPLVPVLEGYTWIHPDYMVGTNEVGYILQNLSAGTTDITASLFIYSLED